jgi:hypothetical protein
VPVGTLVVTGTRIGGNVMENYVQQGSLYVWVLLQGAVALFTAGLLGLYLLMAARADKAAVRRPRAQATPMTRAIDEGTTAPKVAVAA